MISVLVSSLSLVVIVVVTVVLVNKSIDDEGKRKFEIKRIVDQVNTVNDSGVTIEAKQNQAIVDINKSIEAQRVANNNFVRKVELEQGIDTKKINGKDAKFETVSFGTSTILSQNEKDGLNVQVDGKKLIGFDTKDKNKRFSLGSEFSVINSGQDKVYSSFDMAGDVILKTENDKARMMLQNGIKGPGVVISGNKVGIAKDPVNANLDVDGNLAISGEGIYMGMDSTGKPYNMINVTKNAMTLNAPNGLTFASDKGINIPSNVAFGGNVYMSAGNIRSSANDKGLVFKNSKVGIGMDPMDNVLDVAGNVGVYGDNIYLGQKKQNVLSSSDTDKLSINKGGVAKNIDMTGDITLINPKNNSVVINSPSGIEFKVESTANIQATLPVMKVGKEGAAIRGNIWGDKLISGSSSIEDVYTNRSILQNKRGESWTLYHNNDKNLVFQPQELNTKNSTGEHNGVFNIMPDGTIKSMAHGKFTGSIDALGDISSKANVTGQKFCYTNTADPLCLEQDDAFYIKALGKKFKAGQIPASAEQITMLDQKIAYLQDQIIALKR